MDIRIIDFPETKVAVLEHRGPPTLEHETIQKLIAWRLENRLTTDRHHAYGVHYNDPRTTPPAEYHVDLCISVEHEVLPNLQGVINKVIPAGRCAVVRHLGSRENVSAATYLYTDWLPNSGETLRELPLGIQLLRHAGNAAHAAAAKPGLATNSAPRSGWSWRPST